MSRASTRQHDRDRWCAADAATNTIYQVDSGTGVTVIDGVTGSATATISAPGAGNVAVDPATDTVFVTPLIANYGGNKAGGIDVVNGATSKVTATSPSQAACRRAVSRWTAARIWPT